MALKNGKRKKGLLLFAFYEQGDRYWENIIICFVYTNKEELRLLKIIHLNSSLIISHNSMSLHNENEVTGGNTIIIKTSVEVE